MSGGPERVGFAARPPAAGDQSQRRFVAVLFPRRKGGPTHGTPRRGQARGPDRAVDLMTMLPRTHTAGAARKASRFGPDAMLADTLPRSLTIQNVRAHAGLAGWRKPAIKFLRLRQFGGPQSPRPSGRGAD